MKSSLNKLLFRINFIYNNLTQVAATVLFLFINTLSFAQPINNNQANATDITSLINGCSANAAYTTIGATADQARGSCWTNGPNYNVWFSFTATTSNIDIQLKTGGVEGTLRYPYLALWNSSLTELSCVKYISDNSDIGLFYTGLTPGNIYYISADNYLAAEYRGTFTLCLGDVITYDFKAGAIDVTSLINGCSANAAYTTIGATADQARGSCWTNGPGYNRWFKFTATASGNIDIQLKTGGVEGTLRYPYLALWNSSLTELSCVKYISEVSDIGLFYTGLTPGNIYYISADNYLAAEYRGTFTLCLGDVITY
ncbi:MAG: hypothetical protein V1781_07555, partial [Bacteroidota bacterium]